MGADFRQRIYAQYEAHAVGEPEDLSRAPYLDHLVDKHFPHDRNARVLDLGCGDGVLLRAAQRAGFSRLTGVDGAPGMVARAHEIGSTFVAQGDLLATLREERDAQFDVVIAFDVLEHLEPDEQLALLDASFRVLAPGGRLILHVPNGEGPFVGSVLYGDATHVMAFTSNSLRQLFRATGFSRFEFFEDRPVVHGVRSALRSALWHAIRVGWRVYGAAETGSLGSETIFSRNLLALAFK